MSLRCPDCKSSRIRSYERGVDVVNGFVGYKTFGAVGLLAANIGADDIINECKDCGVEFEIIAPSESVFSQIGRGIGGALAALITVLIIVFVLRFIIFIIDLF